MKTAVLHLRTYDDVATLQDRLLWARSPRVLLVWPEGGRPRLQGVLDFVLLRRYAARLGARLALVTRDPRVAAWARQAGVPVFATEAEALRRPWRRVRRRVRRPRRRVKPGPDARPVSEGRPLSPAARWAAFVAGVLAVLVLAGFLLPGARVTLEVPPRPQEATLVLRARPGGGPGFAVLTPATVTVTDDFARGTSALRAWPAAAARGEVVLRPLRAEALTLPAGVRIASVAAPEVVFETTRPARLSGSPDEEVLVPVQALTPGAQGNRPAHDLRLVLPPWDLQVTAINPEPTTGGADLRVRWPAADDYAFLRRKAEATLQARAATRLAARFGLWAPASLALVETEAARFDPPEPAATPVLRLTLRQRYRAWGVTPDEVAAFLNAALDARLESDWRAVPDSLTWRWLKAEGEPVPQGEGWAWTVEARRLVYPTPRRERVAALARGRPVAAAPRVWQAAWPQVAAARVQVWPGSWPWMPWWTERVQVVVVPQRAAGR